jgi:hypothetical protein
MPTYVVLMSGGRGPKPSRALPVALGLRPTMVNYSRVVARASNSGRSGPRRLLSVSLAMF